jgi:hypothetical protein
VENIGIMTDNIPSVEKPHDMHAFSCNLIPLLKKKRKEKITHASEVSI